MTEYYKSYRIIDGKPRWIIVDETGKIVNRNPSKDELKGLKKEFYGGYKRNEGGSRKYTDDDLLNYVRIFYEDNGRPPVEIDFYNNHGYGYPHSNTYIKRFGSWSNALKLAELDVESMVKKGILETNNQKGRWAEIIVRDHFRQHPVDLAGENCRSPCDGICPNGKFYDVKSSKLIEHNGSLYYHFSTNNKHKDKIEIYYFLAFNEDYTKLKYAWRVLREMVEKDSFYVGTRSEFNVDSMKEYDIIDKFKDMLKI